MSISSVPGSSSELSEGRFRIVYRCLVCRCFSVTRVSRLSRARRRHEEAIAEARKTGSRVALAEIYARAGRRDEARRLLAEFKALTPNRYVAPLAVASVHAALGEKDQAFDYLEGAYRAGVTALSHVKVEPGLDSLRSDPRFADLLRRMSLD
jgi:Tfp pilus assembly protein PilF